MSDVRGQLKRRREEEDVRGECSKRARSDSLDPDKGLGTVVAKHYNELEEKGLAARQESHIIYMRNFNNWIKSMLINDAVDRLTNKDLTILDMCCGKGGDILKWLKTNAAQHIVFADIAETSVEQCKERYDRMVSGQGNNRGRNNYGGQKPLFSAEFITADCTKERLREKYSNPDFLFDLVSVQFSFHYSFETFDQAKMMLKNISENLKPGGIFIGTTPNACRIVRLARASGGKEFGNQIFRIQFDCSEPYPLFGAKYYFQLEDLVNCPEFLVHFGTLEKLAKYFGLQLIFKHAFDEYFDLKLNGGKFLLERMGALETYPPFNEKKSASEIQSDYSHAEKFYSENQGRKFGTLSKSEWEAVNLYIVFAFQKMAA